jgi:hypothetical protein
MIEQVFTGTGAITCWQIVQIGFISLLYIGIAQKFFTLDS